MEAASSSQLPLWETEYFEVYGIKWHTSSCNVKVGDVILLKKGELVPAKWPLGRVVAVYPGANRVICVVRVQTATDRIVTRHRIYTLLLIGIMFVLHRWYIRNPLPNFVC